MQSLFLGILTFVFCCQVGYAQVVKPFTNDLLQSAQKTAIAAAYHQLLADTNSTYTIEQVATRYKDSFVSNTTKQVGFSKNVKSWWLRFALKNTNPTEDVTFYLLTDDNAWAATEFYFYDSLSPTQNYWRKEQGGWAIPDAACHTERVTETLPVKLKAGEEKVVYVRKTVAYLEPSQREGVTQYIATKKFNDILTNVYFIISIFTFQ